MRARGSLLPRLLVFLLLSGFCGLVYQVAWLRLLRLVFGSSTGASAAVVAIFMGGLGAGSLLLGRRAERSANPLGLYALLEAGVALGAGLSPWTVAAVRWCYETAGGTAELGLAAGTLLRLAMATLVLGPPTLLMGGTLPAAVRAATRRADVGRRALGLVYAVNTLGAVVGATATTFVFVEGLGLRKTIWLAALLNLLVAVVARATARSRPAVEPLAPSLAAGEGEVEETAALATAPPVPLPLVLVAAGGVGFAFFLMELVWYRLLAPILGGSTYTFGVILGVALAGIGLGGMAYGAGERLRRPTLASFAGTCSLEALLLAVPFALGDRLAYLALVARELDGLGFAGLVASWVGVTCLVVLPAALVAGYQFPLLVALLGAGRRGVARQVGATYAANTAGAILGSLAGGFGLLPLLGAPGAWRLAAGLLVVLAAASLLAGWRRAGGSPATRAVALAAGAAAIALLAARGPGAFWRHGEVGAGRAAIAADVNELRETLSRHERSLAWEADGRESSIGLQQSGGYAFTVNGKTDGHARLDAPTQVMSPLVPAALHPAPRTGLVIGLGTGSSAGWLAEVPGMERVDVVELEAATRHVAEACAAVNHEALRHPRVELVIGDGREFLLTTDRRYDVVFSEPSNPYRAGIASLFTVEFYRAAAERLESGGLFAQWLQSYEVDARVVASVYTTMSAVFEEVETWQVHNGDLLLVAGQQRVDHDLGRLREVLAGEPFATALEQVWGVAGAEGFYAGFVADGDFARLVARSTAEPANTDDRPVIEFGFARSVGRPRGFTMLDLRELLAPLGVELPPVHGGELDEPLRQELIQARYLAFDSAPAAPRQADDDAMTRWRARRHMAEGRLRPAAVEWRRQPAMPSGRSDLALLAEALAEVGDPEAAELVTRLRALQPVEASAVEARLLWRGGNAVEAARRLVDAFSGYRSDPWPLPKLMMRALYLAGEIARESPELAGPLDDALAEPFAVRMLDEARMGTRVVLSHLSGEPHRCLPAYLAFEPWPSWQETFLSQRLSCYVLHRHPLAERAARDLQSFLDAAPATLGDAFGKPRSPGAERRATEVEER